MWAPWAIVQAVETIARHGVMREPIRPNSSFDEFNREGAIACEGAPLEVPLSRSPMDDIAHDPAGKRRPAGSLIRRLADRVTASTDAAQPRLILHADR